MLFTPGVLQELRQEIAECIDKTAKNAVLIFLLGQPLMAGEWKL